MSIRLSQFFPQWVAENYALFPPIVFIAAISFAWGLFFEIDYRLMFILSFADYLLYFVFFLSVAIVLAAATIWFAVPLVRRVGKFIILHEQRALFVSRLVMFPAIIFSGFLSGRTGIYVGMIAGLSLIFLFMVPAISAYRHGDINRFRGAIACSLLGLSWFLIEAGRLGGKVLVDGPKRFYSINLQNNTTFLANIILYTTNGVVYRVSREILYSPNDAIIFTRRTGFRKEM